MFVENTIEKMKPSDFKKFPIDSILQKSESETIALNIMKILSRTGDEFRELSWEEYKEERLKDGKFTENEKTHFDVASVYCVDANKAKRFSRAWNI